MIHVVHPPVVTDLTCPTCGKPGTATLQRVGHVGPHSDSDALVLAAPPGWLVGVRIDHGYEAGDEQIEVDMATSYCSPECVATAQAKAIAAAEAERQRTVREVEQRRLAAAKSRRLTDAIEREGAAALESKLGPRWREKIMEGPTE